MTRKQLRICYRIITILSLCAGCYFSLKETTSVKALLSYYTLQSNLICLAAFAIYVILELRGNEYRNRFYYFSKGGITMAIIITMLVYHAALVSADFEMDALQKSIADRLLADAFVHTISPLFVIGDYLLLDEKGKMKYYYPALWLIVPLLYVVYVYSYGTLGGRFFNIGGSERFAYFFLDYTQIGAKAVAVWILGIAALIFAMSEGLVLLDRNLPKRLALQRATLHSVKSSRRPW